jgi:hypothetical protein
MSEIGEIGSPAQIPFTVMALVVASCIAAFALSLRRISVAAGRSALAAYLVGCMAVSLAGVGLFSFPNRFHNVFGISELIGYQAPIAFAVAWRNDLRIKTGVILSLLFFFVIWIAILLNLGSLDPGGWLWHHVKPVIGIAQRALFGAWFAWCAVIGPLLFRLGPAASNTVLRATRQC